MGYMDDNIVGKMIVGASYPFENKHLAIQQHIIYMLNRTQEMFTYNGLPDTIPHRNFELYLQTNGNCIVTEVNGELYAFIGGYGGEPNVYYEPTIYTVANPYLKFNKQLTIDKDCVLIRNDAMNYGLLPMFSKYASLLTENAISMRIADILVRTPNLISAQDDRTLKSAEKYLSDIEKGKLGVVSESAFIESLKSADIGARNKSMITDLIEFEQYTKASWFNELGIDSNYNMKREKVSNKEVEQNADALLPLVDNMLKERQEGINRINEMYGTEIIVTLNSAWELEHLEQEMEVAEMTETENTISIHTENESDDNTNDNSIHTENDNSIHTENDNTDNEAAEMQNPTVETEENDDVNININIKTNTVEIEDTENDISINEDLENENEAA